MSESIEPRPYAGCPTCGAPLVSTLEVRFKEWVCVPCDVFFGFLEARPTPETPETTAAYEAHKATYKAAREARQTAANGAER